MGLTSPKALTYVIKNLNVRNLKDILESIRQLEGRSNLHFDVDCNWVAFKLGCNKNPDEATKKVVDFLECLAQYGFIVTPVCDGEQRHHSKRATTERQAKYEKAKIQSTVDRLMLVAVSQQLQNDTNLNEEERATLQNKQKVLNKSVASLESKVANNRGLHRSFAADLSTELEIRDSHAEDETHHGRVEKVKVGLYQADALIAQRAVSGLSDIIVAADSDFLSL